MPSQSHNDRSASDHGLETFRQPAESGGISLDQLNAAFAQMLEKGSIPYSAPTVDAPGPAVVLGDQRLQEAWAAEEPREPADCPVTPRGILEAALFVGNPANEPLRPEQIAQHMRGVRPAEIDDLVAELNAEYRANGCPYSIESVGGGYRLTLRPQFEEIRDRCYSRQRRVRLSAAAIEVLSIVAYSQPITTSEVDRLRGKSSGAILRQLVRRQLLEAERTDTPARALSFRTTERFLELFGLSRIEELPRSEEIDRR